MNARAVAPTSAASYSAHHVQREATPTVLSVKPRARCATRGRMITTRLPKRHASRALLEPTLIRANLLAPHVWLARSTKTPTLHLLVRLAAPVNTVRRAKPSARIAQQEQRIWTLTLQLPVTPVAVGNTQMLASPCALTVLVVPTTTRVPQRNAGTAAWDSTLTWPQLHAEHVLQDRATPIATPQRVALFALTVRTPLRVPTAWMSQRQAASRALQAATTMMPTQMVQPLHASCVQ